MTTANSSGSAVRPPEASGKAKNWYIVHTYSGFEERVRQNLKQRVEAMGMAEAFGDIRIPTETLVEMKGGKRREIQRKFFPGYIIVEMEMSDDAWHLVKNTPKVTGFVGSGKEPTPLTADEVEQILHRVTSTKEKPKPKHTFSRRASTFGSRTGPSRTSRAWSKTSISTAAR